nr:MAG TPA: hypothetical protein [Caudoviricetes sp.]
MQFRLGIGPLAPLNDVSQRGHLNKLRCRSSSRSL